MHPEHLQIRRHAIAAILNSTTPIDPQSDLASQHRTRTHNAIVIAGAITGILGNIDCNLASEFADALGIGLSQSATPQQPHEMYRKAQLDAQKAELAMLRARIATPHLDSRFAKLLKERQEAEATLLEMKIAEAGATSAPVLPPYFACVLDTKKRWLSILNMALQKEAPKTEYEILVRECQQAHSTLLALEIAQIESPQTTSI